MIPCRTEYPPCRAREWRSVRTVERVTVPVGSTELSEPVMVATSLFGPPIDPLELVGALVVEVLACVTSKHSSVLVSALVA